MNHLTGIREKLTEAEALLITDEKNQRYACGFPFTSSRTKKTSVMPAAFLLQTAASSYPGKRPGF